MEGFVHRAECQHLLDLVERRALGRVGQHRKRRAQAVRRKRYVRVGVELVQKAHAERLLGQACPRRFRNIRRDARRSAAQLGDHPAGLAFAAVIVFAPAAASRQQPDAQQRQRRTQP